MSALKFFSSSLILIMGTTVISAFAFQPLLQFDFVYLSPKNSTYYGTNFNSTKISSSDSNNPVNYNGNSAKPGPSVTVYGGGKVFKNFAKIGPIRITFPGQNAPASVMFSFPNSRVAKTLQKIVSLKNFNFVVGISTQDPVAAALTPGTYPYTQDDISCRLRVYPLQGSTDPYCTDSGQCLEVSCGQE